ncbi:Predicted metalloprotease, contains C-terminal PDZ domain [Maribacter sedimenticola]|uniref:Predicted metalloprotease, contains C-terminal PDZ domain n=1 Tax=Maribacter sedimenticola TaxID=228956 RepID=A0ABY1SI71_9FLAO|nr:PDZ domain-containing protein [Maribacter sedimenticola]SNR56890.1 Predicted metalloprotease, contains C-terminal PDZ domain [Maribacter sedimenticola]
MRYLYLIFLFFTALSLSAQTINYSISFDNAIHHEAVVTVNFPDIDQDTLSVRMSRTSPGRYALHEFAKNVYAFKAKDAQGNILKIYRPNPYEWQITGHNGNVTIEYILFADRGDGTYSQIDESHAHLNIPATFIYAPSLSDRPIEVDFVNREDLEWKIATQLAKVKNNTYSAPNLYYFMDSPTELSNHKVREFIIDDQTVKLALHDPGTEEEADKYFEKVKKVVTAEKEVFGELPQFDYNTYTFLACYIPNASGDGMEHRNSTILTSTRTLANGGMDGNIGTVSHEFFHSWNVERIRPKSLEPFNFEEANMSGALWFAEGFTSYYTNLILCRATLISPEKYIEGLTGTFNYVWNSPALQFFNPIEMSYQAPFVDAATSVDPVNRENTFISYYSYGSVLGLALDLSLREQKLNLDDFMKLVWSQYGKTEIPYTLENLHQTLNSYAGEEFGNQFFNNYIYKSGMPKYKELLESVGVSISQDSNTVYFGAAVTISNENNGIIKSNPTIGSPAYTAGLDKGDLITHINGRPLQEDIAFNALLKQFRPTDKLSIDFIRDGNKKNTVLTLEPDPHYSIQLMEKTENLPSKQMLKARNSWLKL